MKRWPLSYYLIAIFCLAVTGWLLDGILFSSSPDEVLGQGLEASSMGGPVVPSTTIATSPELAVQSNVVGTKLHRLRDALQLDPAEVRNAFLPSAAWHGPGATPSIIDLTRLSPAAFASHYQLLAVMVSDNGKYANVNGQVISVGQKVGGYRLVKIGERSVVFEMDDNLVELHLEQGENSH